MSDCTCKTPKLQCPSRSVNMKVSCGKRRGDIPAGRDELPDMGGGTITSCFNCLLSICVVVVGILGSTSVGHFSIGQIADTHLLGVEEVFALLCHFDGALSEVLRRRADVLALGSGEAATDIRY